MSKPVSAVTGDSDPKQHRGHRRAIEDLQKRPPPPPAAAGGAAVYSTPLMLPILMNTFGQYEGSGWTNLIVDSTVRYGAVRTNYAAFHTPAIGDVLTHFVTIGPQGSQWDLLITYKARTDGGKFTVSMASVTETAGVISDTAPGSYITIGGVVDTYQAVDADYGVNGTAASITIAGAPGALLTSDFNGGPGTYSMKFEVTGKNAASSGYRVDLTGVAWVRSNEFDMYGGF